jgi:hypothetical protein
LTVASAVDAHPAVMLFDYIPADRQPEAETTVTATGTVGPLKAREHQRKKVPADPVPGVYDTDLVLAVSFAECHVDAALRRELHRVGQHVAKRLFEARLSIRRWN